MRHIAAGAAVVAVSDGTRRSDDVIAAAGRVAVTTGAALHVVHALNIVGQPLPEAVRTLHGLKQTIESTDDALRDQLERVAPGVAAGQRIIAHHGVTEALLRHAREQRVSAVLSAPGMLTDPHPGSSESPALRVAELLRCPVLIVKRPLSSVTGRVLVAIEAKGMSDEVVDDIVDCITALQYAGLAAQAVTGSGADEMPLQVELAFVALDPSDCVPGTSMERYAAVWTRALKRRSIAAPRWSVAWSEPPGRHLTRRAADPALDFAVLHRTIGDSLTDYEVLDSVHGSAMELAVCPVLVYPTRMRAPLRPLMARTPEAPDIVREPVEAVPA